MPPQAKKETSLKDAAFGALADIQGLIGHAAKAISHDTAGFSRTIGEAAWLLAAAWATMVIGGMLVGLALVYGLAVLVPALPVWAWFAIIGLPTVGAGVVLCISARQKLASLQPDPAEVDETADDARQTAEQLGENIESAKASINRGVESMKSAVESIKQSVDLNHQVQQRPWIMLFGAAGLGFVGGAILHSATGRADQRHPGNGRTRTGDVGPQPPERQEDPGMFAKLGDLFAPQAQLARDVAVGTIFQLARDWVRDGKKSPLSQPMKDFFDESEKKFGGRTPPPNAAKAAATNGVQEAPPPVD